jgi:hypothetical protein
MNLQIKIQCFAREGNMLLALLHVEQKTPPAGCFSFYDGVVHFAEEDVRYYPTFLVRLWVHPSGWDMREIEVESCGLRIDAEAPRRITTHEEDSQTDPPRLEGSSR